MGKFHDNLRGTRRAKGLTQDQLAERAGLSAKHIGEIERGNVSPSLDVIEKLARGLNVDQIVLIGDDASRLARNLVRQEILGALDHLSDDQLRSVLRIVRLTGKP